MQVVGTPFSSPCDTEYSAVELSVKILQHHQARVGSDRYVKS